MLNLTNLPDLGEVKAQVDRIEAAVLDMQGKVNDIALVFEGLKQVLPMVAPSAPSALLMG